MRKARSTAELALDFAARSISDSGPVSIRSRRASRTESVFASALLPALLLIACAPPAGKTAASTESSERPAEAAPVPSPTPAPTSLGALPDAVARLEGLREEVEAATAVDGAETGAIAALDAALRRITRLEGKTGDLPYDELLDEARRLASTARSVNAAGTVVATRLRRLEDDDRKTTAMAEEFEALARLSEDTAAPPALRLRAGICRAQLEELSERIAKRRAEVLLLVDKVAEARGKTASLKALTDARLSAVRRSFAVSAEEPIWALGLSGRAEWTNAASRIARDGRRLRHWFQSNLATTLPVTIVFFGGTLLLLHRLRAGAERRAAEDPASAASLRFMRSPVAAAVPVTVLALATLAPEAPAVVYDYAWLLAAPAAAAILERVLGERIRRSVWLLAASLAMTPFAGALASVPLASRLVSILATAPLAFVLATDLYRGRVAGESSGTGKAALFLRSVGWLLAACLGVAAVCHVVGRVGLGSFLSGGALGALGGIVLVVATYSVATGLVRGLLATRPLRAFHMVREHPGVVADWLLGALRLLGVLVALGVSVHSFGLTDALRAWWTGFLAVRVTIGSITLSPASLVGFAFVLWLSTAVARALGFLLAEEVFPRFDLRRGTAVAISGTTRYVVLLAGFVMAAGVAGVDLAKFGFLAGALGVGIGFGLQNIVGNFVSGLILLFERPIQVGDVVDVAGAAGTVTQIGIRASKVTTFDGSDVIVPNADLISKPVVNWTGSNPNRRFDVTVGVAYGSSMESTARALLAAARRTSGIIPAPSPEAFFRSFGDSSLDWTLRLWIAMDASTGVLSALRQAVSEELAREGIEIPFPQRVLHGRVEAVIADARP